MLRADLDQELSISRRLGERRDLGPVRAVVAANTTAIMASRLRSAAVSPRLTTCSSASSRPKVSTLGSPPTSRVAAAWNEPQQELAIEAIGRVEGVLAGDDRFRHLGGQETHHGEAERRLCALAGVLDRRPACSIRPAASGMRAADSAAPRSSKSDRRTAAGVSSSSARRRNRTAWSADPRSVARRAESVNASNAHCSPTGPAGLAASR